MLSGSNVYVHAQEKSVVNVGEEQLNKPLYKPFIERYILDELKQLRQDQLIL